MGRKEPAIRSAGGASASPARRRPMSGILPTRSMEMLKHRWRQLWLCVKLCLRKWGREYLLPMWLSGIVREYDSAAGSV